MCAQAVFATVMSQFPQDTRIRFKNTWEPERIIPVSSKLFALYCPRMAALLQSSHAGVLPLQEPSVSAENFATWVAACQYQEWEPRLENFCDLEYLCEAYGTPSVAAEVQDFVGQRGDDCLIPRLLWALRLKLPSAALERQLRAKLAAFAARADTLELPLHVLDRVLRRAAPLDATAAVRGLLARALAKWGPPASRLCASVDLSAIADPAAEIPGFDAAQLRCAMGERLCELKLRAEELKRRAAA